MPFAIGPKTHNVIPKELKQLVEDFFSLMDWEGLYLTGGTCLAEYYFGHRLSEDVDLFTQDKKLFDDCLNVLKGAAPLPHGYVSEIRTTPYIHQHWYQPHGTNLKIKIDVVLDAPRRIAPPIKFGSLWIDNLEDILSNKIGCVISRSAVKDYLDLYHLIPASHLTTKELIVLGQVKDGGVDPVIMGRLMEFILRSPTPPPEFLIKTDWQDLQLFFRKLQKECFELIRPGNSG